jgi:hypothetical protein
MIGWVVRFALFRLLPRRIVPILTLVEIIRLAWGLRRRRFAVNDPRRSRTAPPSWSETQGSEPSWSEPPTRR